LVLQNTGPAPETILLEVSGPTGWNARFETSSYPTIQIGAVYLLADPEKKTTIKFRAKPPSGAKAGEYTFNLVARTTDGKLSQTVAGAGSAPTHHPYPGDAQGDEAHPFRNVSLRRESGGKRFHL
jgi:hypothetical protein